MIQKFHYSSYEILLPLHMGEGKKKVATTHSPPKNWPWVQSCMQKHPGFMVILQGSPVQMEYSLPVPPGLLGCTVGALPAKLAWILTGAFSILKPICLQANSGRQGQLIAKFAQCSAIPHRKLFSCSLQSRLSV